jgi:hypothetical protein
MARTLRALLAAKGFKITNSESLELIAKALGVDDWNTLSAMIQADVASSTPNKVAPSDPPEAASSPRKTGFSADLEKTLHRSISHANQRRQEYATLEHLLLALIDDPDSARVMAACNLDTSELGTSLTDFIDRDLGPLIARDGDFARPTASFQRVIQRAVIHVQASGREAVTGANVLVAIFSESESRAARLLDDQGMSRLDAVNFLVHGIVKGGGGARTTPA